MTQVDFYILGDSAPKACPLLTCKLAEKAWKQGHRVFINTGSAGQMAELDDLLWTFRAGSFIPHGVYTDSGNDDPVALGHDVEPAGHTDVLVNLSTEVPPFFSRFERVAELVDASEQSRAAARERYRYYQDRGYSLNTHKL